MTDRFLVVGLGTPGPAYAGTRHNVGFLVADLLAVGVGGRFKAHRGRGGARADVVEGRFGPLPGTPVVLAKPQSYMNDSGGPVTGLARFFDVPADRLVVVHDELDLPYGSLRLKLGGGDNGHNGLRSITRALGTRDYLRVRFGIGRPPGRMDPADYVLRDFAGPERKDLDYHVDRAADATEALVRTGLTTAQNTYND